MFMEALKTKDRQSNLEEKQYCGQYHQTWFQIIWQHKSNVKQHDSGTGREMQINGMIWGPRYVYELHLPGFWQRRSKHTLVKSIFSWTAVAHAGKGVERYERNSEVKGRISPRKWVQKATWKPTVSQPNLKYNSGRDGGTRVKWKEMGKYWGLKG